MAYNNGPSSYPTTFTSTPAAMSSFLATQTFFTTSAIDDPAPTPLATTSAADASATRDTKTHTSKSSPSVKVTPTRASSSSSQISSAQTDAAGATLSNSNTSTGLGATSPTGSTLSTSFTSPAAASATNASLGVLSEEKSCSSISCSPGLQAAVAVPITLIGLGLIIAFFIFSRRRRRRDSLSSDNMGGEPRGSKWSRHLRVFSFDAELLIGGRSSRATSVRTNPATRSQPSMTSIRSQQPSVRSLESPAPPYRDAIAGGGVQMAMRPDSSLTAPPPYIANRASHRPNSRLSAVSPVPSTATSNPFADPEGDEPSSPSSRRSTARRSSSAYDPIGTDDTSFASSVGGEPSEAGSIRQAEVARRVSGARPSNN